MQDPSHFFFSLQKETELKYDGEVNFLRCYSAFWAFLATILYIISSFSEHLGVPNVPNFNRHLCFNLISWPNTMVGENLVHLFIEGNMPTERNGVRSDLQGVWLQSAEWQGTDEGNVIAQKGDSM